MAINNPLLNLLNQAQTQATSTTKTTPTIQTQNLPTSMTDPRMQQAKDYVASHGGDPKTAFLMLCKERGIDPQSFVQQMMGQIMGSM